MEDVNMAAIEAAKYKGLRLKELPHIDSMPRPEGTVFELLKI